MTGPELEDSIIAIWDEAVRLKHASQGAMHLTVRPIPHSPYFDVVDTARGGAGVIRAAYCTRQEAELFASAPGLRARVATLQAQIAEQEARLRSLQTPWVVRAWEWCRRIARRVACHGSRA